MRPAISLVNPIFFPDPANPGAKLVTGAVTATLPIDVALRMTQSSATSVEVVLRSPGPNVDLATFGFPGVDTGAFTFRVSSELASAIGFGAPDVFDHRIEKE